jgi:hypothetical protein
MKKLDKLKYEGRWVTDLACLKSCIDYLGTDVTDGWLYGVSGHAFALNIHEELCPSGPTAWNKERIYELAQNVGCKIQTLSAFKGEKNFTEKQQAIWELVKKAIDQELPCYGWELDIPEHYLIYGYDDTSYLYSGCSQENGSIPWNELGNSQIGVLQISIVSPAQAADDKQTIRQGLQFAMEHSKEPARYVLESFYKCGLDGYEQWIKALGKRPVSKGGMAFNTQVWAECRQNALAFLKEAKERVNSGNQTFFDKAIQYLDVVAQQFKHLTDLFEFKPDDFENVITDKELLNEAARSLHNARQAEAVALAEFEHIVDVL